jgi:hypothetical protein
MVGLRLDRRAGEDDPQEVTASPRFARPRRFARRGDLLGCGDLLGRGDLLGAAICSAAPICLGTVVNRRRGARAGPVWRFARR